MSGSYNVTLFEVLQLSKVEEKTYKIKSAKWNNELANPQTHKPTNQEPRLCL